MDYRQLTVTTFFVTIVAAYNENSCQTPTNIKGLTVNFSAQSLAALPSNMNESTSKLVACHNKISILTNNTFNSTRNLTLAILRHNEIRQVDAGTFQHLKFLQELDLGHNMIEYIDKNLFRNNIYLYKINLEYNLINHLHRDTMKFNKDLWKVIIGHNKINDIDIATFSNIVLTTIDISGNIITDLDFRVFENKDKISTLDMSSNKISTVHRDMLKSTRALRSLNMSHNQIKLLEKDLFRNNINLQSLDISNNAIENIHVETFKYNPNLENIIMNNNKLNSLHETIFFENVRVKFLDISYNKVYSLNPQMFRFNTDLRVLNLKNNRLSTLDEVIFSYNTKLKFLDLSSNKIASVYPQTFAKNFNMEYLNLSSNLITAIFRDTFKETKKLKEIDLSNNTLTTLDSELFSAIPLKSLGLRSNKFVFEGDTQFLRAPVLEILDLGSCNITKLMSETFQGILNLRKLKLDNNHLKFYHSDQENVFSRLYQLQELDLSSNSIISLSPDLLRDMESLKLFDFSSNPLVCSDCRVKQLHEWCIDNSVLCVANCSYPKGSWDMVPLLTCSNVKEEFFPLSSGTEISRMSPTHKMQEDDEENKFERTTNDIKEYGKEQVLSEVKTASETSNNSIIMYICLGLFCTFVVCLCVTLLGVFCYKKRRRRREENHNW